SPTRGATSHRARNARIATEDRAVRTAPVATRRRSGSRTASAVRTWRRPRVGGSAKATVSVMVGLLLLGGVQPRPGLVAQRAELGGRPHVLGRLDVEVDVENRVQAAGAGRHDRDALAEVDGLVDAVRDEDDRLAGRAP